MTLKSRVRVVQGRWIWCRSTDHIRINAIVSRLPFSSYLTLNNVVTLKSSLGSLKVIGNDTIRKLGTVSYLPSILYCFWDKAIYCSKIAISSYPLYSTPPLGGSCRNITEYCRNITFCLLNIQSCRKMTFVRSDVVTVMFFLLFYIFCFSFCFSFVFILILYFVYDVDSNNSNNSIGQTKTWKCQGIWQLSGKCQGIY